MKRFVIPSLILAAAFTAACAQDHTPALEPAEVLFNTKKGGGGGGVTSECGGSTDLLDSRIDLRWEDGTGSGIRSDGKNEYKGGQGGVHGKIFYHDRGCSRSFDAVFDPDASQSSNPRKLVFHFPADNDANLPSSGVASGPFMNFTGLMRLGSDINTADVSDSRDAKVEEKNPGAPRAWEFPGTEVLRPDNYPDYGAFAYSNFGFSTDIEGCERLEYDKIKLTRKQGIGGYQPVGSPNEDGTYSYGQWSHEQEHWGEWTVESIEPHLAQCFKSSKGTLEPNGAKMAMPFKVTITERRP